MNRRDAIAALTSLPIAAVGRLEVRPESVIVVEAEGKLSAEAHARLLATVRAVWPNQRVIVCDQGIRLRVVDARPGA